MIHTQQSYQLFHSLLEQQHIHIHYQPVVALQTGDIFGYEALTRFPDNPYFRHPGELFTFASEHGKLFELEKVTRELAIQSVFHKLTNNEKLWLNLSPDVMYDRSFTTGYTHSLLEKSGIKQNQIVFEITERSAIQDFDSFKRVLKHYRQQGFLIAIDDAGAGYSSLEAITELQPDYIKIDRSLIRNIDQSSTRQYMLEALMQLSSKMGAGVIAEGIETKEELQCVIQNGVPYAQGYFIARPDYPIPSIRDEGLKTIQQFDRSNDTRMIITSSTTFYDVISQVEAFVGQVDNTVILLENGSYIPFKTIIQFVCYTQLHETFTLQDKVLDKLQRYCAIHQTK
ncbi:EAL domain-containing protein [Pontibacillus litoralis]|uniref:Diguanylate phosphodiesterase n=1 Tax=Pontibacillus litoralis JSM 072002 TaxID=1385512 RepID=A0A0A5HVN1_9BACI|nr:EAL domain-containing protein [Pontibacillus litoralis]KGX87707.1 diguanylate phosphodiesterase [Pontibacillus litoralis JSM 072002]